MCRSGRRWQVTVAELIDKHWLAASLLGLALCFVVVVVGSAWASRRRSVTLHTEVLPGGETGAAEAAARVVEAMDRSKLS